MELYNKVIKETYEVLEKAKKTSWEYREKDAWKDAGSSELVLQSDAAYEMGATGTGSVNYLCPTSSSELVAKDEIILIGPDMPQIKAKDNVPFGRIAIVRVGVLDDDDEVVYRTLKDIEFCKYHVFPEGYMVRMSPESHREQIRVSKKAVKKKVNFKAIGADYIKKYKEDPNVLNVKIIFITDPSIDFDKLVKNAKLTDGITSTLTHILEGLSTDCSVCSLKDVCDEVEGMKELHFGRAAAGEAHD